MSLFRFLWKLCVEFRKTRGREGGRFTPRELPYHISSSPFPSLPSLSLLPPGPFLPQRAAPGGRMCHNTLRLSFPLPTPTLSGTEKQLVRFLLLASSPSVLGERETSGDTRDRSERWEIGEAK